MSDFKKIKQRVKKYAKRRNCRIVGSLLDIAKIYSDCPDGYTVDHVIPLKHDLVSGLFTAANLQYLALEENRFKGNHWDRTTTNRTWHGYYKAKKPLPKKGG